VISGLRWVGTFAVTLVAKRRIAWFTASNGFHLKVTVLRTATSSALVVGDDSRTQCRFNIGAATVARAARLEATVGRACRMTLV
jgi:hypothetical protein